LKSTRGVELGKSGIICQCSNCSAWSPLSEQKKINCHSCGKEFNPITASKKSIISKEETPQASPFITGGDLRRYVGRPSRWIKLGIKGINYKPASIYQPPKILLRKTGVGITAMLDYAGVYTNQVVYILRGIPEKQTNLEFYIGLINSRAYFFYLVKSFGELEWKSHPYLTQTQILNLPLPDIESEENKKIVQEISQLLRPVLKKGIAPPNEVDAAVEALVGKLFSFNENDYRIIFNAIKESDELIPIMDLKKISFTDVVKKLKR
jgi:adenine-specific DNA-methyltransferase